MPTFYTNYPIASSSSSTVSPLLIQTKGGDTSNMLDSFLTATTSVPPSTNSKPHVRFAFPSVVSASSHSDGSSVEGDSNNSNQYHRENRDNPQQNYKHHSSSALIPYHGQSSTVPHFVSNRSPTTTTLTLSTAPMTDQKFSLVQAPPPFHPFGTDAIHPKKKSMKKQRKRKTAAGAVGGMVVGGLTLGPAGVLLGGAAGAVVTHKICKARERRAQRKYEQGNFQQAAEGSSIHQATFA